MYIGTEGPRHGVPDIRDVQMLCRYFVCVELDGRVGSMFDYRPTGPSNEWRILLLKDVQCLKMGI